MRYVDDFRDPGPLRSGIEDARRADETAIIETLLGEAPYPASVQTRIAGTARRLVEDFRGNEFGHGPLDAFLQEYGLSNQEGVVLMCLAEALLRIPDAQTADRLIHDKLTDADWDKHLGKSDSLFVNFSTWALMLTGRVVNFDDKDFRDPESAVRRLVGKSGEPVIRRAMIQAMRILGRQFVMGRNIGEALARAREEEDQGFRISFDMLGEAARTAEDAEQYFKAYTDAIVAVADNAGAAGVIEGPGISIKLSALHPRYELAQHHRVMGELMPRLKRLSVLAMESGMGLCVDAEEAAFLDLSLDVIEELSADPDLDGWNGLGLAVQAYQKCSSAVLDWLADMAARHRRRLMVRLVKGAYWDSEIKRAQELGLVGYPVFTRKVSTDVSFLACAKKLLAAPELFYPQFATHNAHTIAAVMTLAGESRDYEFQRLHGMSKELYSLVKMSDGMDVPCRIYAPVGSHEDLLAYLVRRLLENGSNTSFVNRIVDEKSPIEEIIADPVTVLKNLREKPHPRIPLPTDLFGGDRRNSLGEDLSDPASVRDLARRLKDATGPWRATPVIGGVRRDSSSRSGKPIINPAHTSHSPGLVVEAVAKDVAEATKVAAQAAPGWDAVSAGDRATCLEKAADMLEEDKAELMAMCICEAGKTLPDAIAEVREAVDFCRYYANLARKDFSEPQSMPGPTGESNQVALHGRGVFGCISPWNFPLAIFTGQVAAALAAGNAVVAKPAEQTPLIAARAVDNLHRAGVPGEVLHFLPGDGPGVGKPLIADPRISGISFTGSVETAHVINRTLARRSGPIVPLIAETGGQNVMIVDSTALPEQVVDDVVTSAFQSAGQRCSALRVLFLQDDISDRVIRMLTGAMAELNVGDPALLATDIGPVIDREALSMLERHARRMDREGTLLARTPLPGVCTEGTFFAPAAYLIEQLDQLEGEVFGPILHVIRYAADRLDEVIDAVNAMGFGLTLGIHSRVGETQRYIQERVKAGNAYVNRSMIGAVVGVQPFGGEGLSGTGPKAGGPRYLHRFALERTLSLDTAAAGGNAALLSLEE